MKRGVLLVLVAVALLSIVASPALSAEQTEANTSTTSFTNLFNQTNMSTDGFTTTSGNMDDFGQSGFSGENPALLPLFDLDNIMSKIRLFAILGIAFVSLVILHFIAFIIFLIYFFHKLKQVNKPEITPELHQYVSACQVAGTLKEQLQQVLQKQGYDDATIALALQNYVEKP